MGCNLKALKFGATRYALKTGPEIVLSFAGYSPPELWGTAKLDRNTFQMNLSAHMFFPLENLIFYQDSKVTPDEHYSIWIKIDLKYFKKRL